MPRGETRRAVRRAPQLGKQPERAIRLTVSPGTIAVGYIQGLRAQLAQNRRRLRWLRRQAPQAGLLRQPASRPRCSPKDQFQQPDKSSRSRRLTNGGSRK